MIILFFLPKTEKIRPCPGDTGNRKFEQKSRKLKIKPAFCHFHFLRRVGQLSLVKKITKSYFEENFHFLRGSTILERMSLQLQYIFKNISSGYKDVNSIKTAHRFMNNGFIYFIWFG